MKLILIFVVLLSALEAFACELFIPKKVMITDAANGTWPFESKNCNGTHFDMVYNIMRDQDGNIPLARLQAAVQPEIKINSPGTYIYVSNMASYIRQTFPDVGEAGIVIGNPFQGNLISLPENSESSLNCHPCQFNGEEVMRLNVKSFVEGEVEYTFQVKFSRFVNAYKARQNIPAFSQNLTPQMFESIKTPATAYGQYLNDLSQLKYFKTNKTLRVGDMVRTTDLVPQTLVKAGDRVELIFENTLIKVKSQALSRQNGGIGDSIEVWNQNNGKKYVGKVRDHKSVVIEL